MKDQVRDYWPDDKFRVVSVFFIQENVSDVLSTLKCWQNFV